MTGENVEIVHRSLNRWVEVDEGLADTDSLYEFFAPEAVFECRDLPDSFGRDGQVDLDGFLEIRATWIESYDDWSYSAEKILDAGGDKVVGTFRQRGKLRGTEEWIDMRYAMVYAVEKGMITGGRLYLNREEGLKAAGLSE